MEDHLLKPQLSSAEKTERVESVKNLIREFNLDTHGSSDFGKDEFYILDSQVGSQAHYVPFHFLQKKLPFLKGLPELLGIGFIYGTHEMAESELFHAWYEKQFSKKIGVKLLHRVCILYYPDHMATFKAVELVNKAYDSLREALVLINNKNFPTQLGEWYAKCIFGLKQVRTSSQRGFDFFTEDDKRVEVKIHWGDVASPKGVKIKKSLVELSDSCIIIYVSKGLMIREICWLDSDFVTRKFGTKGHTIFLKAQDISSYYFSRSSKHFDKIMNTTTLMKFASPQLAMKLDGRLA